MKKKNYLSKVEAQKCLTIEKTWTWRDFTNLASAILLPWILPVLAYIFVPMIKLEGITELANVAVYLFAGISVIISIWGVTKTFSIRAWRCMSYRAIVSTRINQKMQWKYLRSGEDKKKEIESEIKKQCKKWKISDYVYVVTFILLGALASHFAIKESVFASLNFTYALQAAVVVFGVLQIVSAKNRKFQMAINKLKWPLKDERYD